MTSFLTRHDRNIKKRISDLSPKEGIRILKKKDLILVSESLRQKVEEKRILFQAVLEKRNLFPGDLSLEKELELAGLELGEYKKQLGKAVINSALRDSAVETNSIIMIRPLNKASRALIGHNAVLKPSYIKAKTAKAGLVKGLIPVDQSLTQRELGPSLIKKYNQEIKKLLRSGKVKKEALKFPDGTGVVRDGRVIVTSDILASDKVIEVLVDREGARFTADIDLFTLGAPRFEREGVFSSLDYGTTNQVELDLVHEINRLFRRHDTHRNVDRDLVLHGSEAFNPNPVEIEFPIRTYLPDGRALDILEGPEGDALKNLREFFEWAQNVGYPLNKNPGWAF